MRSVQRPSTDVENHRAPDEAAAVSRAVIQVREHGPGVPWSSRKNLSSFYRVPNANGAQTGALVGWPFTERMFSGCMEEAIRAATAHDGGLLVELVLPLTP